MGRFVTSLLFFIFLTPVIAHAQCENPPAEMGVIIFNKAHKVMQYCNGDDWVGLWGGGSGSGTADLSNLNASNLTSGTVPRVRLGTGTADNTTFLRGDGTWSSVLSTPPTCTGDSNALQWDGGSWNCANIEGGGGFDLVNGQHSSSQCTGIGGTVVTSGTTKMCRINGAICPAGWVKYQNWSTFAASSPCVGACFMGSPTSCTAPARAWSNNSTAPTCTYTTSPDGTWCTQTATCTATLTQIACY